RSSSSRTATASPSAAAVSPTSFPDAVLAVAGGAVALDVLYRDPLSLLRADSPDASAVRN
ncbi:hypothetical protein PV648_31960, partial [Streptomyces sp. ID05-47C]|nr:hypothetical protein [Streptomyces sp. ID05-47C]